MKKVSKKIFVIPAVFVISLLVIFIIIDSFVLPYVVSAEEYKVPNVIGRHKDEAIKILKDMNLNPVVQTSRFDAKYEKDHVIFQKPHPNTFVKESRRIYLTVSGGDIMVKVPFLINKTVRDAKVTLERIGLVLGEITEEVSEFPSEFIFEQEQAEGTDLPYGSVVNVKVSLGPQIGMIRVPSILGKSLRDAESILKENSLKIGLRTFIQSSTLLPNTVVDQQPSENTLVGIGDSVNVVLTQSK